MKYTELYEFYKGIVEYDIRFLQATRNIPDHELKKSTKSIEQRYIKAWRFASVFRETALGKWGGGNLKILCE